MTEFEKKVAELNLDRSNWKLVKFDDVAIQQKQKVDRENTDLTRYVKGEHMHSEDLHLREWGELTDEYLGPAFIRKFEQGDILYGSRRTYLRKVVLAPFEGITSNTTFVVKANEQKIDKRLLPFIMLSEGFSQHSIKNSKGSVNPYVNWKDLAGYDFLLPSKSQQEEIANLLWSIDNVIETRNETLNQLTLVYLTKLESELLDKNSEKVSFSDLGDVIRGVGYKPDELIKDYSNDACIVLRANNIKDSNINFDNINILDMKHIKSNQILQDGDFAICMSNGSKDLVGKAAELENVLKNVAVGSFCAAFRPNSEENRMLLKHLFSSASYRMSVKRTLSGSTINNLKPSDIESMFFRVNVEKSKDIIYDLDSLMLGEKKLKTEIHTLKQLQKSIINQVF